MALLDGDGIAGCLVPVGGERRVVLVVELAGRVVADVEQMHVGGAGGYYSRNCKGRDSAP